MARSATTAAAAVSSVILLSIPSVASSPVISTVTTLRKVFSAVLKSPFMRNTMARDDSECNVSPWRGPNALTLPSLAVWRTFSAHHNMHAHKQGGCDQQLSGNIYRSCNRPKRQSNHNSHGDIITFSASSYRFRCRSKSPRQCVNLRVALASGLRLTWHRATNWRSSASASSCLLTRRTSSVASAYATSRVSRCVSPSVASRPLSVRR